MKFNSGTLKLLSLSIVAIMMLTMPSYAVDLIGSNDEVGSRVGMLQAPTPVVPEVVRGYGNIYLMKKYTIKNFNIQDAEASNPSNLFLTGTIGKNGYLLSLNAESASVRWSVGLIGTGTVVSIDSMQSARWVAAGTSAGEVVVIDDKNPAKPYRYYTATGGSVNDVVLLQGSDWVKLAVLDSLGHLYIYNVSSPYWVEFAPYVGEGAYKSLSGLRVHVITPEKIVVGDTLWKIGSKIAVIYEPRGLDPWTKPLSSSLKAQFYYYADNTTLTPAIPETRDLGGGITERRSLKYWVTVYPTDLPETLSGTNYPQPAESYIVPMEGLIPGTYKVHAIYEIELISSTGETLDYQCYYGSSAPVKLYPFGEEAVNVTMYLTSATSPEECPSPPDVTGYSFTPVIIADVTGYPEAFDPSTPDYILLPTIMTSSPVYSPRYLAVLMSEGTHLPSGWDSLGVKGIMILGESGGYVYIFFLNDKMKPMRVNGKLFERLSFPMDITAVAWSKDLSKLYIGDKWGNVYELVWDPTDYRYVVTRSMKVSVTSVSSLFYRSDGVLLAVSADGSGQAIDTVSWIPYWRDMPGYIGAVLGIKNPEWVWSLTSAPFIAVSLGGEDLVVSIPPNDPARPLNPLAVITGLEIKSSTGDSLEPLPAGSRILVYENGNLVAESELEQAGEYSSGVVYLPEGQFNVVIESRGEQVASFEYQVSTGYNVWNETLKLRLVEAYVFVPEGPEPGYALVSGPIAGANVTATPMAIVEPLPYTPITKIVWGISDANGTAYLTLWQGVEYNVSALIVNYTSPGTILGGNILSVNVPAYPRLYDTTIKVLDSEAYTLSGGAIEYYVSNASLTITRRDTGKSVTIELPNGQATLGLPAGHYIITAKAEHYKDATIELNVKGVGIQSLEVLLEPIYYPVTVSVYYNDNEGLAVGPVSNAVVNATLLTPQIPRSPILGYTGSDGSVVLYLRAGTYKIRVSHPYTESTEQTLTISGETKLSIELTPKYSYVRINVLDEELADTGYTVMNAIVTVTYLGSVNPVTRSYTLTTGAGVLHLPYGPYAIEASATYYYKSETIYTTIVTSSAEINIKLKPIKYDVTLNLVLEDELWGLVSAPLPGARVVFELQNPPIPIGPITVYSSTTGDVYVKLRPGVYKITIIHDLIENYVTQAYIGGSTSISYKLSPAYVNVSLRVSDADTEKAIPGVEVRIEYLSLDGGTLTITLNEGSGSLMLPVGEYRLTFSEEHYMPLELKTEFSKGEDKLLDITLQPKYAIVKLIVKSTPVSVGEGTLPSRPIPKASITLIPDDPLLQAVGVSETTFVTGSEGSVAAKIRVGAYQYRIIADYYNSLTGTLSIKEGSGTVTFELTPILYNISIKAIDPEMIEEYREIRNFTIVIINWDGLSLNIEIPYNQTGLHLPKGLYTLIVSSSDYLNSTVELDVPSQRALTIELNPVKYPVTLRIKSVTMFGETYAPNILVYAVTDLPLKNPVYNATADINGLARLSLRKGKYTIYIKLPGLNKTIRIDELTVEEAITKELKFTVPSFNVKIDILDKELNTPLYATLIINYLGPYGSGIIEEKANGTIELQLPCGQYSITINANAFKIYTKNINIVNDTTLTAPLDPIKASVVINVVDPDGNPVDGALVRFESDNPLIKVPPLVTINGRASPREEIRIGNYTVYIEPPADSPYLPTVTRVEVREGGVTVNIMLEFKVYNVTIVLIDKSTGEEIPFTYTAKLERKGAGPPMVNYPTEITLEAGKANLSIPYGTYTVALKAVKEDYFVIPPELTITIGPGTDRVVISLVPKTYTIAIMVVNDRGEPLPNALITIRDIKTNLVVASGFTAADGSFQATLKYGNYEVRATAKGYKESIIVVYIPQQSSISVSLEPTPLTIIKRFSPLIVAVIGLSVMLYIISRVRERIAMKLLEEEEYF